MSLRLIVFCALMPMLSLTAIAENAPKTPKKQSPFQVIAIADQVGQYLANKPVVIRSKDDVKRLVVGAKGNPVYKPKEALKQELDAVIERSKVDFSKQALVLLPHYEGSISYRVLFQQPELKKGTLKCRISRERPEDGTEEDIAASYCFALIVNRSQINKVEWRVGKHKAAELQIQEKSQKRTDDSTQKALLEALERI